MVTFTQIILVLYRLDDEEEAFWKTTSMKDNVVERFWPGMNSEVNYLIKNALNEIIATDVNK